MKYTVSGFNQSNLVSLRLGLIDAEILRWFVDFQGSGRMREFVRPDGVRFYLVSYKAVIEDLPAIEISSISAVAARFKKLAAAQVLDHFHDTRGGSWSCYKLGPTYISLVSQPEVFGVHAVENNTGANAQNRADPSSADARPPIAPELDPSIANAGPLKRERLTPSSADARANYSSIITLLPDSQERGTADGKRRYRDSDIDAFVKKWNAEGLPEYRRLPVVLLSFPHAGEVVEALSFYAPDEIISAIEAYSQVVKNRADFTWGATYPNPSSFFVKGVPVFCPGSKPLEVLRKAGSKDSKPTLSAVAGTLVCSHCGERKSAHYCTNGKCPVNNEDGLSLSWVTPEVYKNGRAV